MSQFNHSKYFSTKAFAVLEIMLATVLLVGLVYLILHSMSNYHKSVANEQLGVDLSPVISDVLETIGAGGVGTDTYHLVKVTSGSVCSGNNSGLLTNVSQGYLNSMEASNFSLCSATVKVTKP